MCGKPTLVYLVGLPASGKSTYANMLKEYGCNVHSSDSIREELYGDESIQHDNGKIFGIMFERTVNDLNSGVNVVYDATNIDYKRRMEFLKNIKERVSHFESVCVVFATPYDTCIERNKNRSRRVPEDVILRMVKNFYVPQYYEGWDHIVIRKFGIPSTEDNLFYKFDAHNFDQKSPYHTLSLGDHMIESYNVMLEHMSSSFLDANLAIAAFYHDIGKAITQEWSEEKHHCTYYNHQNVSAYLVMCNGFIRCAVNDEDYSILDICNLIQWHMRMYQINTDKSKNKFINLVGEDLFRRLEILHDADKRAH